MSNLISKQPSLLSAIALSVTGMVGSGWLFSAQLNAKIAGNYAFWAWLLAAFLALAVGLCLAQVVIAYPVRGVTARVTALSHNHVFGMSFAFAAWFGLMAMVATEAQATTQYLAATLPQLNLMTAEKLNLHGKALALIILFIYLLINYFGIRILATINNTVTILKVVAPVFTIGIFLIANFDHSNFSLATNTEYTAASIITAMISAGLVYSYNGFQISVAFASELKNPQRNIPLALCISIAAVLILYLILQLAFMGAVPHELLTLSGWAGLNFQSPLINVAMLLGFNFLTTLLLVDSIVSPSGTGFSYLGSAARMFYAMSAERQLPQWAITKLHPLYNICRRSLLINWVLTSLVLWNSDSWAALMVIVTGYNLIGYMAAPISMGAINGKTRWWGVLVFMALSLVMATIPKFDFLIMNLSLMLVMLPFGIIQLWHKMSAKTLINLVAPFLIYLWLIYFFPEVRFVAIMSAIFYLWVTNRDFVNYCVEFRRPAEFLE